MAALNPFVQRLIDGGGQDPTNSLSSRTDVSITPADALRKAVSAAQAGVGGVQQYLAATGAANKTFQGGSKLVDAIAHAIRDHESGGNYNARNKYSTATGAYQFLTSTYANLAKRYGMNPNDWSQQAQDAVAKRYISSILQQYGNDPGAVAATWYVGSYNPGKNYNYVPGGGGNAQTVAAYMDYLRNQSRKYL
jgi:hypothetical protein